MEVSYFFDSYALIEMAGGNPRFAPYHDALLHLSFFNTLEVYWALLRDYGEERAKRDYRKMQQSLLEIRDEDVFEAMQFRLQHKKKDFSYADCIGYVLARRHGLRFLTGDRAFQGMENVEFVK